MRDNISVFTNLRKVTRSLLTVLEDKNFNMIILSKSEIRMQIYEELIKKVPMPKLPPYLNKKNPFIIQITNETRHYILAAKTEFDCREWFTAISAQIETIRRNESIKNTRKAI